MKYYVMRCAVNDTDRIMNKLEDIHDEVISQGKWSEIIGVTTLDNK